VDDDRIENLQQGSPLGRTLARRRKCRSKGIKRAARNVAPAERRDGEKFDRITGIPLLIRRDLEDYTIMTRFNLALNDDPRTTMAID
jgi:hypothetical protein